MNHIYKVIFCKATGVFVAVAEFSRAHGKKGSGAVGQAGEVKAPENGKKFFVLTALSGAILLMSGQAWAAIPEGTASGANAIAIGAGSTTAGNNGSQSVAIGNKATVSGDQSVGIGADIKATGNSSIAIGGDDLKSASQRNLDGTMVSASNGGTLNKRYRELTGSNIDDGFNSTTTSGGDASVAVGVKAQSIGHLSTALGTKATASEIGSLALGMSATADKQAAVALGAVSNTSTNAERITDATVNGITYSNYAGQFSGVTATDFSGRQVSVGSAGYERQIKNVAPGGVTATSTDAINGSQLYSTNNVIGNVAQSTKTIFGGAAAVDTDGKLSMTDIGGTGKNTIDEAIKAVNKNTATHYYSVNSANTAADSNYSNDGATGANAAAIGLNAKADGSNSIAIGTSATTKGSTAIAVGSNADAGENLGLAFGPYASATGKNSPIAVGTHTFSTGASSVAFGDWAYASGDNAIAIGGQPSATATNRTEASGAQSIAIGNKAQAKGTQSISIGMGNVVSGDHSGAIGDPSIINGANSYSVGNNNFISAATDNGFIYGGRNNLGGTPTRDANGVVDVNGATTGDKSATHSVAIGYQNSIATASDATDSVAIGSGNTINQSNTFVLGKGVTTSQANSVVLGNASTDRAATTETNATVNGITYGDFAGQGSADRGVVSVGSAGNERQIINVAAGQISATSTDAINGSQLYLTNNVLGNVAESTKNILGGNAALTQTGDDAGNITMTNIGGTGKNTIDEAIKASRTKVQKGTNVTVASSEVADGHTIYTINAKDTTAKAGSDMVSVIGTTDTKTNVTDYSIDLSQTAKDGITKGNSAVQTITTRISNDNGTSKTEAQTINQGEPYADFVAGDNITLSKADSGGIKISSTTPIHYYSVQDNGGNENNYNNDGATGRDSLAIGINALASGQGSTAIGGLTNQATAQNTTAVGENNIASGIFGTAIGGLNSAEAGATAIGNNNTGTQAYATAIGRLNQNTAAYAVAIGSENRATGTYSTAIGYKSQATANNAIAVGNNATAPAANTVVIGNNASVNVNTSNNYNQSVAIGNNAKVGSGQGGTYQAGTANTGGTAVGHDAQTSYAGAVALGSARARASNSIAIGAQGSYWAITEADGAFAVGNGATVSTAQSVGGQAIGRGAIVKGPGGQAYGQGTKAYGTSAIAIGGAHQLTFGSSIPTGDSAAQVGTAAGAADRGIAIGSTARVGSGANDSIALGSNTAVADGAISAIAIGNNAKATGTQSISIGTGNIVSGNNSGALGDPSLVAGSNSYSVGNNNVISAATDNGFIYGGQNNLGGTTTRDTNGVVTGSTITGNNAANRSVAIGFQNNVATNANINDSVAIGSKNTINQSNTFVLGNNVTTTQANSVVLGNASTDRAATTEATAAVNGITYGQFAGQGSADKGVISVGSAGNERQIINVAAGQISATSTDAINGSQLYLTQQALGNVANSTKNIIGGNTQVNSDGTLTVSNIGGTGKDTIDEAIKASKTEVKAGTNVASVEQTTGNNGQNVYTINADGAKVTAGKGVNVEAGEKDSNNITNYTVSLNQATQDSLAKADSATQDVIAGDNITVTRDGNNNITVATKPDVTFNSITAGDENGGAYIDRNIIGVGDNSTGQATVLQPGAITVGGPNNGIRIEGDAGKINGLTNKTFDPNNIVSGQAATEDQLQQAAAAATTKLEDGTATTVGTRTNTDGSTTYNVNVQTDGTTLTVNGDNQLTAVTTALNSDGKGNTNATNPDNLVKAGDIANAINNAGFNLQTNGDTASLVKNGDTVQLLDGQNIAITRDGNNITVATKPDVTFNSITAGDENGGAYIDRNIIGVGDNSTGQATVLQPGAITVGGPNNGIRIEGDAGKINGLTNKTFDPNNIVSGQAATEDQLQQAAAAATTKLEDGTATTVSSTPNADGSTTYKVNAQTDGTTLTVNGDNQLTAVTTALNSDGKGNTNATNPDNLVKAGDIANAINNAGFNLQTNGDEASLIKNGDTVQLLDGQNIAITREGNNITVATKPNVVFDSVKAGNTTINQDGIDNGGNRITNVAKGVDGTDAVNVDQLNNAINSAASSARTEIKAGTNIANVVKTTGENAQNIYTINALGASTTAGSDAVTVTSSDAGNNVTNYAVDLSDATKASLAKADSAVQNIQAGQNVAITRDGNNVTVATTPNLVADSLTTGDTVVNNAGLTINNGPSVTQRGINAGDQKITNVAAGDINADSKDAVNGSQLYATNQNVTQVQGDVAKLNNGAAGVVRYSNADTPTTPNGGVVSNDVTLVGKANEPVTIHNVAPGRAVTDAVNVGQLSALEGKVNNAVNKLGYRIDDVHDQANAGISAAMATAALPQAFLPGKSMVSGGLASYNGEGAVAVGVSTLSDNGRWVIKLSGTADTQGNAGGSIGAGFHW